MSDYFERIEQQLVNRVEATHSVRSRPRLRLGFLAPAVGVAVVLIVVAVFLGVHGARQSHPASSADVEFIYQAEPTPRSPVVTNTALERTVEVIRERAAAMGDSGVSIGTTGPNITVRVPPSSKAAQTAAQLTAPAQLSVYDWEANALLPDGSTVASKLLERDPTALHMSQGAAEPGTGGVALYQAVRLAARQPASRGESHLTDQYYLFGNAGTQACAAAARFHGVVSAGAGQHCLLAGPADSYTDLVGDLPPQVTPASGRMLVVKPGTVVLQAVAANPSSPPNPAAPSTQFYVLKDNVALGGIDITNPHSGTDNGGNPDVQFGFTHRGAREFTALTAAIAHRGSEVSGAGTSLQQHFAVALDGVLITVPQIDFAVYPDGIPTDQGAEISSGFTVRSARKLATELRFGALPLSLQLLTIRHRPG